MQGTVVMLLALSGLGCHHKKAETAYTSACYSSCYSSSSCYSTTSCYSSMQCYSSTASSCYSSCYSSMYESCYSSSCYSSSCYSSKKHKHGLFGCKKKSCAACCAPAESVAPVCDACGTYSGPAVYGTYTPAYSSSQTMGTSQTMPMSTPAMAAPTAPVSVTPPTPTPAPDAAATPAPTVPPPPVPVPDAPKTEVPKPV